MEITIFLIALGANALLLVGLLSSVIGVSNSQFWPPPSKSAWQYHCLWWSVRIIVLSIAALAYFEWGAIDIPSTIRFWVAMPIFLIAFTLGSVAASNLGWTNTHGVENGFVDKGFYRFSRNPQYVLFSICFIALSLVIASPKALVLLWLLAVWYLIAPFPEERWLEDRYGEQYLNYKQRVPRYF